MSQLRSIVERVERLEEEIKGLNDDKRDIYAEAKANGFDVKALKAVIAYRRKDPTEREDHSALVETYLAELERGTVVATRVRAHEKKIEPAPVATQKPVERASAPVTVPARAPEIDLTIPPFLDRRAGA